MTARCKKILITGQSGLVGIHVIPRLDSHHDIVAISRNPVRISYYVTTSLAPLDLYDLDAFDKFLGRSKFDIIINCAAMSDVDRCETERKKAGIINTDAVAVMAAHCRESAALLIHISTDYIFDGKSGPYAENAEAVPINYYGVTKLEADNAILNSGCEYAIVRTNHVYGNGLTTPSRLVRWVSDAEREGRQVLAAGDQFSNPTWAGNLADAIVRILDTDFRGIVNVGGADYVSRFEFAQAAAEIYGININIVRKVALGDLEMVAPRPLLAGLKTDKMRQTLGIEPVGIHSGLKLVYEGVR